MNDTAQARTEVSIDELTSAPPQPAAKLEQKKMMLKRKSFECETYAPMMDFLI